MVMQIVSEIDQSLTEEQKLIKAREKLANFLARRDKQQQRQELQREQRLGSHMTPGKYLVVIFSKRWNIRYSRMT